MPDQNSIWRSIWFSIRSLLRRNRIENELDSELRFHVESQIEANIRAGMSSESAHQSALREFGAVALAKEECRDQRGTQFLEQFWQDVRYSLRMMRRNPGFTSIAVLTLALGVGVNTSIFSILNGIVLRPLPYKQPNQIVLIRQHMPKEGVDDLLFSVSEINDYRQQNTTLSAIVEYHIERLVLQSRDTAERVRAGVVSHDFFDLFGVEPILGRSFLSSDEQLGAPPVLLLSYEYWQEHGGDPGIVGKTFVIAGAVDTVIGVLPPFPQYPDANDIFMTTTSSPFRMWPERITNRNRRSLRAFGRLKPDVTVENATRDTEAIASRLARQYPSSYPPESGYSALAVPLKQELTSRARSTLWVLLAAAAFVLLIACANLANFTLARLSHRRQELSLRMALGADRNRLYRQLSTESALLGLLAATLGFLLAIASHKLLVQYMARLTPRALDIHINGPVLFFAMATGVLASIITGALLSFPVGSPALKLAARQSSSGVGQRRVRNSLIVVQVALSLTLLSAAGVMIRSFIKLQHVDPGFISERVLTMSLDFNESRYATPAHQLTAAHAILEKLQSLPGVQNVAISSSFPLDPDAIEIGLNYLTNRFQIEGHLDPSVETLPWVPIRMVSESYFQALQIPLVQGRTFLPTDKQSAPAVAVINRAFAQHRVAGQNPIGKRITKDGGRNWITIIGVVGDTKEYGLSENLSDQVYYPLDQVPSVGTVVVRTATEPMVVAGLVRNAISSAAPETAISHVVALEDARNATLAAARILTSLLGFFAGLALLVAASGIAGILALSVSQRVKEIGIRLALGAKPSDVLGMIVSQGMILVAAGLACGLTLTLIVASALKSFLFQVSPEDPYTLAGVCGLLAITALVACYLPARKAMCVDPMVALRHE